MPRSAEERIRVGVADMAVTDGDIPVVTSGLGSCVAVVIHDGAGRGGLLHAMLPEAPDDVEKPEKYVDSGIETMVAELTALGAKKDELIAKVAGGASMLNLGNGSPVGEKNVAATEQTLSTLGIDLVAVETGGDSGRSVSFDPTTGSVRIRRVDAAEDTI
ncbi:MAG: chemotaxis protein CheD [Halanaeroarchaeum sp.]